MKDNEEWVIQHNELEIYKDEFIGEGEYGKVYKGRWRGTIVAIKEFPQDICPKKISLMRNEFEAMTKLHHPNIIQLLGYTEDPFMIVMEYIPCGNLSSYLRKNRFLSTFKKIQFAICIAKGLSYLHGRKPSLIIHRDLKPSNFLVTEHGQIKIADFGLCKVLVHSKEDKSCESLTSFSPQSPEYTASANVGTFRYMAPEMMNNTHAAKKYSSKVDIYSFGAVLYEIFESVQPYSKILLFLSSRSDLVERVTKKTSPLCFVKSPPLIRVIIKRCLEEEAKNRPSALEILKELEKCEKLYKWWCWDKFFA